MKTLCNVTCSLVFVGLLAAASHPAAAQQPSVTTVRGVLTGPRVAVFTTPDQSCSPMDIPDAPTRAFRDYQGTIHLISASTVLNASLGPTLESVQHNCQAAYWSKLDPNPADYDDRTWLDSFYNIDGTNIVALGHMEYHGWSHPGECSEQGNYSASCWYNADTFHLSKDGGYHFASFGAPANYVAGVPYTYVANSGPEGYSIDTNIVKAGDWCYAVATGWSWPGNCNNYCRVYGGGSPIRTSNILDPSSWRAWNGQEFSVSFADPYLGSIAHPFDHIFSPIFYLANVNAINVDGKSGLFVATIADPFNDQYGPPGLYLSTSPDMVQWSTPTLVVTIAQLLAKEPKGGDWTYGYFSLLDPNSTDDNFSTITDNPYLYYVRSDNSHCCYTRVLFRQRIKLTWK